MRFSEAVESIQKSGLSSADGELAIAAAILVLANSISGAIDNHGDEVLRLGNNISAAIERN